MTLSKSGKNILTCNVSSITEHGFWLIIEDKEYFVPFKLFPEFKKAKLEEIFEIEVLSPQQLHWKKLDYDIELQSLERPDQFPLHFT